MDERRVAMRHKSFLQGRIYFNGRRSSVDCLVREISDTGARLKFSTAVVTPDVVELHIPSKDEIRAILTHAQGRWRPLHRRLRMRRSYQA